MFKESRGMLYHEADIDMQGNVMLKHKSEVGKKINIERELIGIK